MNAFSIDSLPDAMPDCLLTLFKEVRIICSSITMCISAIVSHFSYGYRKGECKFTNLSNFYSKAVRFKCFLT